MYAWPRLTMRVHFLFLFLGYNEKPLFNGVVDRYLANETSWDFLEFFFDYFLSCFDVYYEMVSYCVLSFCYWWQRFME